jgi:hypothetical protein
VCDHYSIQGDLRGNSIFWHVILCHCEIKIKTEVPKPKAETRDDLLASVLGATASRKRR